METDITSVISQLDFRVLAEFDETYNVYVARCLETNAVATGETLEEAEAMIKQILENDFRIAIQEGSLKSLIHVSAPWEVVQRWHEMKVASPDSVRRIALEVEPGPSKRGVQSELRLISKTRENSSAA